jgi:hypothetical protein
MKVQPWIYEHYKGKQYEVIGEVFHSETRESMVLYKVLYNSPEFWENTLWIRPKDNFFEILNMSWKKCQDFVLFLLFK